MPATADLVNRFTTYIIDPAILLVFTAGFLLFVWGIVEFLWGLRSGEASNEGKMHMLWGIAGMLVMVSVYGIVALIDNTFGLDISNPDVSRIQNVNPGANFFGQ